VANADICRAVHFIDLEEFIMDFFITPLIGHYMVHWLRTLGPILWDITHAHMSCWCDDHQVVWHGVPLPRTVPLAHVLMTPDLMDTLLQEFDDVFSVPTRLPPPRRLNHRIHLVPGTASVAVWSYRYLQFVRDELERQCRDMLQQGIIRLSSSALSPVLPVKKQDVSRRLCVDYLTLNTKTVCNMFPIPVVNEFLDELRDARFFTKLDLRSGYHHVRMDRADIEKTAFITHHRHFEFLVMSFGRTNTLVTFQTLMNEVFHDFIRVFVLVFFDNILIFSSS
jgi:hypothetical protein